MVSDVLFEASQEIRRYMEEMPETYGNSPEVLAVLAHMEEVQHMLDKPPTFLRVVK